MTSLGAKSCPGVELKELCWILEEPGWEPPERSPLFKWDRSGCLGHGFILQKWGPAFCQGHGVLHLGSSLLFDLFCFKVQVRAPQVSEAFKMSIQTAKRSKTWHLRGSSWNVEVVKKYYIVIAKAVWRLCSPFDIWCVTRTNMKSPSTQEMLWRIIQKKMISIYEWCFRV